jgi:hypothetical protein
MSVKSKELYPYFLSLESELQAELQYCRGSEKSAYKLSSSLGRVTQATQVRSPAEANLMFVSRVLS